jgi:hypothetical protein
VLLLSGVTVSKLQTVYFKMLEESIFSVFTIKNVIWGDIHFQLDLNFAQCMNVSKHH